jgi:hypothetical protein
MKSLRHTIFVTLTAALMAVGLSIASKANAAYTVTFSQVGNDVVANGTGSLNLADLANPGGAGGGGFVAASSGTIGIGPIGGSIPEDAYTGPIVGPTNYGPGGVFVANIGSGNLVELYSTNNYIYVYEGYVSGNPITNSSTWTGTTIAGLGLTPGTYTWTWGAGGNADSFTIIVPGYAQAVPTLGALNLIALVGLMAAVALVILRRRLA